MEVGKYIGHSPRQGRNQFGRRGKRTGYLTIGLQVGDVKKPVISVKRICKKGSVGCSGPEEEDNHIQNKKTKDIISLKRKCSGS